MSKAMWIARQSRHPSGYLGRLVAKVMALDTAETNDRAIVRLAPRAGERFLDIGCGHGRSLTRLSMVAGPDGQVAGIDPSDTMLREGRLRNRRAIDDGRVVLRKGSAEAIPFDPAPADPARWSGRAGGFDAVLSVHCLHFWDDLGRAFAEIRRVLRPGGRVVVVHRHADDPRSVDELPAPVYRLRSIAEVEHAVHEAGLRDAKTSLFPPAREGRGAAACLEARG